MRFLVITSSTAGPSPRALSIEDAKGDVIRFMGLHDRTKLQQINHTRVKPAIRSKFARPKLSRKRLKVLEAV